MQFAGWKPEEGLESAWAPLTERDIVEIFRASL